MNQLQAIAADYASQGLTVFPAFPETKVAAIHWRPFQVEAPSQIERDAMFAFDGGLNICVAGGTASGNLAFIDAETERAFETQLERCDRAGLADTWIDRSPSKGGHIWLRLPVAVKSRGKVQDVEVKAQDTYCLAPPSVAVSKIDGELYPYQFVNRPERILQVESLDQLHWLNLAPVAHTSEFRAYPRKAQTLLRGEGCDRYDSRSDAEQAIVTIMVNGAFSFEEILTAFRTRPAAGKFASIETKEGSGRAVEWLKTCWQTARLWTIQESPGRRLASEALALAHSIPWPGRSGSTQRAVFIAHAGLAHRSGHGTYHASTRDLAEVAGCDRHTAGNATKRLRVSGFVEVVSPAAYTFATRYKLPDMAVLLNLSEGQKRTAKEKKNQKEKNVCVSKSKDQKPKTDEVLPTHYNLREGVGQCSSISLPECFRHRGLGRACYETLLTFSAGELSVTQISEKTGRHVQTVRKALARLKKHGLAAKTGKLWRGRAIEDIDLDALTKAAGMRGAAKLQHERHKADRLRHEIKHGLRAIQATQPAQREHGDSQHNERQNGS